MSGVDCSVGSFETVPLATFELGVPCPREMQGHEGICWLWLLCYIPDFVSPLVSSAGLGQAGLLLGVRILEFPSARVLFLI